MATKSKGGYDFEFVEIPQQNLECSICLMILRDPHVTSCCGNLFCHHCISQVLADKRPCPLCNETDFTTLFHKGVQRKVNALVISCKWKRLGCEWQGKLGEIGEHLDPREEGAHTSGCGYVLVECRNKCGKMVERRQLGHHEMNDCPKRPVEVQMSSLTRKLENRLKIVETKLDNVLKEKDEMKNRLSDIEEQNKTLTEENQVLKRGTMMEKQLLVKEMEKLAIVSSKHHATQERGLSEPVRGAAKLDMPDSHKLVLPVPLSFIKPVKLFQVTKKGEEYVDDSLGLHIVVPEGAVSEDYHLKLEVGMCLHGPFLLPPRTIRTSPILMLHPQENTILRKPIEVTLPHIVSKVTKTCDIQVIKADFRAKGQYSFCDIECSINMHRKYNKSYATFSLTHFCFISLRAKIDRQEALTCGYCICALCPFPLPPACSSFSYFLALTFDMDPCIEEVRQLFQERNYTFFMPEVLKPFSLKGDDDCIKGKIFQVDSGWKASLMDADDKELQEVKASAVDMWSQEEEKLKHRIKRWLYPPTFRLTLISQQAYSASFLKIKFVTQSTGEQFYLNLPLQLPKQQSSIAPPSSIDAHERLSIEKLKRLKCLCDSQLDQILKFEDLPLLAKLFDNATHYLGKFGLDTSQIADIETKKSGQDAMYTALNLWHQKDPSTATYRNLLTIILSLDKGSTAFQVCDFLAHL